MRLLFALALAASTVLASELPIPNQSPCTPLLRKATQTDLRLTTFIPLEPSGRSPYDIEVTTAGFRLTPDWRPAPHERQFYLYIVLKNGEVWITPQHALPADRTDSKWVATHRALSNRAREQSGAQPEIIASGQLDFRYQKIARIDNRSGEFPGDSQRTDLARDLLKQNGLEFYPNATDLDFSKTKTRDPEEIHDERMTILAEVNSPEYITLRAQWEQLLHRAYQKWPSPNHPGGIDVDYLETKWPQISKAGISPYLPITSLHDTNISFDIFVLKMANRPPERVQKIADDIEKLLELNLD